MQHDPRFIAVIDSLENDQYFAVTLFDLTNGKMIGTNVNKATIEKTTTIVDYFNNILSNGVSKIGFRTRRKNGSSWEDGKEDYFELSLDAPQKQQATSENATPGLNGGLTGAEIRKLVADSALLKKSEEENQALKILNKELEQKVRKTKEKAKGLKGNIEPNPYVMKIIETVGPNGLDKLEGIIGRFFPQQTAATPGLGNPNLSEVKNGLIEVLQTCDEMYARLLAEVYDRIDNDDFVNKVMTLLKEFPHDAEFVEDESRN